MPVLWGVLWKEKIRNYVKKCGGFCCIKSGCDYSAKDFDALRRANENQSNNLILRKNSNSI